MRLSCNGVTFVGVSDTTRFIIVQQEFVGWKLPLDAVPGSQFHITCFTRLDARLPTRVSRKGLGA